MVVEIAKVKQFTVKVVAEAVVAAVRTRRISRSSSHRKGSFSREVFPGGIPPCPLVGGPLGALEGTPYGLHHSLHHQCRSFLNVSSSRVSPSKTAQNK